ncbi:hypothetical protein, partial [Burkholderia cenocepacia]|uniref:hypothetical protein n=1 Tax=Burkholderia cenocepacia TaxID=95486 RepID=UPI00406D450C
MLFNQVPALALTALLAIATHGQMAGATAWWWSAAAGVRIAISLPTLYMALGIGPMAVVAPVTALIGSALPVLFRVLVAYERPSLQAYIGFLPRSPPVALRSGSGSGARASADKTRSPKG